MGNVRFVGLLQLRCVVRAQISYDKNNTFIHIVASIDNREGTFTCFALSEIGDVIVVHKASLGSM